MIEINQKVRYFIIKTIVYQINVPGEYNILNALAAIEVGLEAGIVSSTIKEGLKPYKPIENRWQAIN